MVPNNNELVTNKTKYTPQKYVHCICCGAILGFYADVNGLLNLFVFRNPPRGVRSDMDQRDVGVRIRSGRAYCPHCDTWQPWYTVKKL